MQKSPITVNSGDDRKTVLQLMRQKDILQVPVLDETQRVVGLEVMQDIVYGAPRENPVLLMAGGFGKRLQPLTKELPKPLLTVGDKPILETIVEQLSIGRVFKYFSWRFITRQICYVPILGTAATGGLPYDTSRRKSH